MTPPYESQYGESQYESIASISGQHTLNLPPALVLNADFRPLSYYPLSLLSWQDSVKAIFMDRVNIIAEYDDREVCSPSLCFKLPSVIALKEYVQPRKKPAFTRFNVFLRDKFECQYCGEGFQTHDLTFDHVIPRAKGGGTSWDNIVAACQSCNTKKGSYLPNECKMHPRHTPKQPTAYQLKLNGKAFPPNFLHEDWSDYLYWDSELQ